jgi:hypothetical protein
MHGVLTEHGTLMDLRVADPLPAAELNYARAALGAVSLWRFEPAMAGKCPVVCLTKVTFSYRWY